MNVVHFLWALNQGGAENLAIDLANEQARDHHVALVVGNDSVSPSVKRRLDPAVRYQCIGRPTGSRNPYWVARLLWALNRLRPDVIHSHTRDLAALGRLIFRPMILTVHSVNMDFSPAVSRYNALCCISESVFLDVRQRCPARKLHWIDNGVVIPRIAPSPDRAPSALLRAVQVSRLAHEIKGQDLLIRALAAMSGRCPVPRMTVDFVGEGPSLHYLRDLAVEVGVGAQCRFLGALSREEVYARLGDYDLLVQPSRREGFGLTVVEGMAAGIPVLVSNIEGPMEIIGNGEFGHSFDSGDAEALAIALEVLAAEIRCGSARQRTIAARQHVEETYSLQRMAAEYDAIYRDVAERRP